MTLFLGLWGAGLSWWFNLAGQHKQNTINHKTRFTHERMPPTSCGFVMDQFHRNIGEILCSFGFVGWNLEVHWAKNRGGRHTRYWAGIIRKHWNILFRSTPLPVTVTTRIITFLVGDPYKPSFATVTGRGVDPIYYIIQGIPTDQPTKIQHFLS